MRASVYNFILAAALFLFACIPVAQAQIPELPAGLSIPATDTTVISMIPQYPRPNQSVTLRAENYTFDPNTLEITWTLNGTVQKRGVGEREFTFTTGNLGSVSTIIVSSSSFSKTIIIRPVTLDLIWQTDTYVPPLYKGKALYSNQSAAEFVAMPSFIAATGAMIDPKTLVYTWSRNGEIVGMASGYGKNVFTTSGSILAKPIDIAVEVATQDGSMRARGAIQVVGTQPQVLFYEDHPLYGMLYSTAMPQEFTLVSREIALIAVPYFFDADRKNNPALSYKWRMNNQPVQSINPFSIVLRKPDGVGSGSSNISLEMQHTATNKMMQFASKSMTVNFAEEKTSTTP